jgi:hypothetical protein
MGCVLLWASACGVAPEEEGLESEEAEIQRDWRDELPPRRPVLDDPERPPADGQVCDRTRLQQLEEEARALVQVTGCTDVSQCQSAPVGALACGGPRDYVVYCSATTDEGALRRTLRRLEMREDRYNQRCSVASICIFISPPEVELVNGVCRAAAPELPFPTLP